MLIATSNAQTARKPNALNDVRTQYDFALIGFVVMPDHIHLLMSEPNIGNPSDVMKALKQRVSRALRRRKRGTVPDQGRLWADQSLARYAHFWQRRFYDFNVWSERKRKGKLNYMHFNPVKRGLVERPTDWLWSSCRFYAKGERGLCAPNFEMGVQASERPHVCNSKRAPPPNCC